MASSQPTPLPLTVTPRVRRLPSGQYVGYIEHQVVTGATPATESFVAGTFNDRAQAQDAACRLMKTFRESVVPSGLRVA